MVDYVIPTSVKKVMHKQRVVRVIKTGKKTEDGKDELHTEYEDLGWFVLLEDSWESSYIGQDKPDLEVGDKVDLVIRKR